MDVSRPEREKDPEDGVEHSYNGDRDSCPSEPERSLGKLEQPRTDTEAAFLILIWIGAPLPQLQLPRGLSLTHLSPFAEQERPNLMRFASGVHCARTKLALGCCGATVKSNAYSYFCYWREVSDMLLAIRKGSGRERKGSDGKHIE